MGKAGKKPRKKENVRQHGEGEKPKKKEKDWGFDEILRSKTRRY